MSINAPQKHQRHYGDLTPTLPAQLWRKSAAGVLAVVPLTGLTVKFKLVSTAGVDVIAETETGVTVTDAANGKVTYDFQAPNTIAAGTYHAYFVVYTTTEPETFPPDEGRLEIIIHPD